jgi:hypothetical protein
MFELFTAVLSHSAGNTGVTGVSFLHLATCFAINARSRVQLQNRHAQTAAQSSHGPPQETATWHMKSASRGGTHEKDKNIALLEFIGLAPGVQIRVIRLAQTQSWFDEYIPFVSVSHSHINQKRIQHIPHGKYYHEAEYMGSQSCGK